MSKICSNCSQPMGDNDKFCASCGAQPEVAVEETAKAEIPATPEAPAVDTPAALVAEEPVAAPVAEEPAPAAPVAAEPTPAAPVQPQIDPAMQGYPQMAQPAYGAVAPAKKKGKGLLVTLIIVIAALVLGGAAAVYFIFFNGGYKEPVENFFDYMESFEADDLIDAVGEEQLNYYLENKYDSDIKTLRLGLNRTQKMYDVLGVDIEVDDLVFGDADKINSEDLDMYTDDTDGKLEATDGYYVNVTYKAKGGDTLGLTGNQEDDITVIKINGRWCVSLLDNDISSFVAVGELSDDEFNSYLEMYKNMDESSLY